MAFKLTKKEITTLGDLSEAISKRWSELEDVTNEANEKIKAILAEVTESRESYEGAVNDATSFVDDLVADADSGWDDKSEGWQESDRGEQVRGWIDDMQSRINEAVVSFDDDLENFEIEMPEDVAHHFDPDQFPSDPSEY